MCKIDRKQENQKKGEKSKKNEEQQEKEERKCSKINSEKSEGDMKASTQKWHPQSTKSLVKLFEEKASTSSDDFTGDKFKILGGKQNQLIRCTVTLGRELGLDVTKPQQRMHHSDWRK